MKKGKRGRHSLLRLQAHYLAQLRKWGARRAKLRVAIEGIEAAIELEDEELREARSARGKLAWAKRRERYGPSGRRARI